MNNQHPTLSYVLPYEATRGDEAIEIYNSSGKTAMEWQELLTYDIMAVEDDGLWTHASFGWSVPRQNGKNEILTMRELWGLENGERILHTAHRTTTSHTAYERLCGLLDDIGYFCAQHINSKDNVPEELIYDSYKAMGLEYIRLRKNGAKINFRTRSSKGGLGESYDLLVVDEAQEYTDDQDSALKYTVAASPNAQVLYCGTPPTVYSIGTVFPKYRTQTLHGKMEYGGWAEWSIEDSIDIHDTDRIMEACKRTNPSYGKLISSRTIKKEMSGDSLDFNIQRLGFWVRYNQKSAISTNEWELLKVDELPELAGKLHVGIKAGNDGRNISMSIAVKTTSDHVFIEAIDCVPVSYGTDWIIEFLSRADIGSIIVDGASQQAIINSAITKSKEIRIKPILPTVKQVIAAFSTFEAGIYSGELMHMDQLSLTQVVTNCDKRTIGTGGGFGYKAQIESMDISILDSVAMAYYGCKTAKPPKKQRVGY